MTTLSVAPTLSPEVDAVTARRWLDDGATRTVLVDVRESDEHASERIAGARSAPLSRLEAAALAAIDCDRLILHCQGGTRSGEALRLLRSTPGLKASVHSLAGGIRAWKQAGLPTLAGSGPRLSVMRQVHLLVGSVVLTGSLLAFFVHPAFALLAGAMGLGLAIAGATGTCLLASLLGKLPFNRLDAATSPNAQTPAAGACCVAPGNAAKGC